MLNKIKIFILPLLIFFGFIISFVLEKSDSILPQSIITESADFYLRIGNNNLTNILFVFNLWLIISGVIYLFIRKNNLLPENKGKILTLSSNFFSSPKRKYTLVLLAVISFILCITALVTVVLKLQNKEIIPNSPLFFFTIILSQLLFFIIIDSWRRIKFFHFRKSDIVIILSIITFGILILGHNLRFPKELVADEAASWETVRNILKGEYKSNIFSYGYYGYPVFNAYLQAGIIKYLNLGNLGIEGWRFTSIPFALLCLVGLYLLISRMFNRFLGLISALCLLVNPYFMILSRISLPVNQSIFPPLFTVLFLHFSLGTSSYFYSGLAGVISGLGYYVYPSAKISVLIGLSVFLYLLLFLKNKKNNLKLSIVYLFAFIVTVIPIVTNGWVNKINEINRFYQSGVVSVDYLSSVYPDIKKDTLTAYFPIERKDNKYDVYWHPISILFTIRNSLVSLISIFHSGVIYNINFTSSLAGTEWGFLGFLGLFYLFIKSVKHFRNINYILLMAWLMIIILILGGIFGAAQFWRMEPILPIIAVFEAIGLYILGQSLVKLAGNKIGTGFSVLFFMILFIGSIYKYFNTIHHNYDEKKKFDWDLAFDVNDAKKFETVYYLYDAKEGIKYGGGILFNYMHLDDSRYYSITFDEIKKILDKPRLGKLTFYYLNNYKDIDKKLSESFGRNGKLDVVRSAKDGEILYHKYQVIP